MKTYLPIHSSNPEERFVVEKATMEKPEWSNRMINNFGFADRLKEYDIHLASLTKYPFPALLADCPDELIEGVDFRLEHPEKQTSPGSWEVDLNSFIAVPLSVKSGEDDWGKLRDKFFKECTYKASNLVSMPQHELSPHDLFEWFKRQFAIPTQSGEKKNKVLKSESIPEFDEGLKSLTQEQKDRVDRALGESMQEVINAVTANGMREFTDSRIRQAMSEYASIQCKERDAEIADLEIRNGYLWDVIEIKEAAIKELLEGLELAKSRFNSLADYTNGIPREMAEMASEDIDKLTTKHKPTTT